MQKRLLFCPEYIFMFKQISQLYHDAFEEVIYDAYMHHQRAAASASAEAVAQYSKHPNTKKAEETT